MVFLKVLQIRAIKIKCDTPGVGTGQREEISHGGGRALAKKSHIIWMAPKHQIAYVCSQQKCTQCMCVQEQCPRHTRHFTHNIAIKDHFEQHVSLTNQGKL